MRRLALAALLGLAGCETFQVRPMRDTATVTRVFATPEQVAAFCERFTCRRGARACTVWVGDRAVKFLPYTLAAGDAGHEDEHVYSEEFHGADDCARR